MKKLNVLLAVISIAFLAGCSHNTNVVGVRKGV